MFWVSLLGIFFLGFETKTLVFYAICFSLSMQRYQSAQNEAKNRTAIRYSDIAPGHISKGM
jgi:hypothetical protein